MSTKQMARAAVEERLVTIWFSDTRTLSGYLVGMDDYHWLIAHEQDRRIATSLVHKSVDHIQISPTRTLSSVSDPQNQAAIRRIGSPFFEYCRKTFLGHKDQPNNATEEQR